MAEKRMFSKTVIDNDAFIELPKSTQVLYLHLCMNADDEGFVNGLYKIIRSLDCKEEDVEFLQSNGFIFCFDSKIIVITHWLVHNKIRKDRIKPTFYIEEKNQLIVLENGWYSKKCV